MMDVDKVCDIAGELHEYIDKKYSPKAAETVAIFGMAHSLALAVASKL